MSCILRISGASLDVDFMMSGSGCGHLPYQLWRKGEAGTLNGEMHADSGVNFLASEAGLDDFATQVKDALAFLEESVALVAKMARFTGVQIAVLDFGISRSDGSTAQFCHLPPRLVQLAASAMLALEISLYAAQALRPDPAIIEALPGKPENALNLKHFSAAELIALNALFFDEEARPYFDPLRDCLRWGDEVPAGASAGAYERLIDLAIVRGFIHSGRQREDWLVLGSGAYFAEIWDEALTAAPNWPGFKRLHLSETNKAFLDSERSKPFGEHIS
ncbi:MAG: hypothetical protein Q7R66_19580 [Undibacterium sp.]|uniref:hypothetical protein n=1 Tax=Undibacterium sp. TaxID=1914977 RepID=UPI0027274094|nr:hypothetical protein [Undibacterium sp.]MDO8654378.1 hypothetical protein [Undibacterium sp.]